MAEVRRPFHLPVLVGVSAGLYSVGLAVVGGLQADQQTAALLRREPPASDVAAVSSANDALDATIARLETQLAPAWGAIEAIKGRTSRIGESVDDAAGRLTTIEAQLAELRRTAATLATSEAQGSVGRSTAGQTAPNVGSTGVRSTAASPTTVRPPVSTSTLGSSAVAAPPPPPPVVATTGASGATAP